MTSASKFRLLLLGQLCFPAAVYLLRGVYTGYIGMPYLFENYLFMASPHLLVSLLAAKPSARGPKLLWLLSLLNALLVTFQLWILLDVPVRDSGLAWVLYIPLWVSTLSACAIAWIFVRYRGRRTK